MPAARIVAAIDIGTNTALLLVAEQRGDGPLRVLDDRAAITRLGRGLDARGTLDPERARATIEVLEGYAGVARALGATELRAVGTSALRDAGDSSGFRREAERVLGARVEIASGAREAALTFAGAFAGALAGASGRVCVVDIGGGSTEIVLGERDATGRVAIERARSYDVGSVRLFERHVASDPPTAHELGRVDADIAAALTSAGGSDAPRAIGVAATFTTLAAVDAWIRGEPIPVGPGARLEREAACAIASRLAAMRTAERAEIPGVEAGRADVIAVGARIARRVIEVLRVGIEVSHGGLRYGIVEEMLRPD